MAYINKKDTDGVKPLLGEGELGYDKYPAGNDVGRVYVGTGTSNLPLAQKSETDAAANRLDIIEPKLATIEPNAKDDQSAFEVPYNNTVSGLLAADLQGAVDEVEGRLDTAETKLATIEPNAKDDQSAAEVPFVNTTSGLVAGNVQGAIDEVEGRLDTAEAKLTTIEPNAKDDQTAAEVPVTPVGGIAATDVQSALAELDSEKFDKTGGTISGTTTVASDLTVTGNFTVSGTTTQVNSEVTTTDRVLTVNDGEVGAGVTNNFAGIEVDRGTLTNYEFGFNEATGDFELGEAGARQSVATREVTPTDAGVMQWNDALSRLDSILPAINDNLVASGDTDALNTILSYIGNRLKTVTGEADWKTDPDIALSEVRAYTDNTVIAMAIALG